MVGALALSGLFLGGATWPGPGEGGFGPKPQFYAKEGREQVVQFRSVFRSRNSDPAAFRSMSPQARQSWVRSELEPLFRFFFGPLVRRHLGGPLRTVKTEVEWDAAQLVAGKIEVPYRYTGVWMVRDEVAAAGKMTLPVPRNVDDLFTPNWKSCTERDPEHGTPDFLWYFWDPARPGCEHKRGREFEEVAIALGAQTRNESRTSPEYGRLFRLVDGRRTLAATFAFGYVQDPRSPDPERDRDPGVMEYRRFVQEVRQMLAGVSAQETAITLGEYPGTGDSNLQIGHRFSARLGDAELTINVVAAAGVDQMVVFAKSYAHDHDGLFAWLGHSRVGNGFDADRFARMVKLEPSYYTVSTDYQIIYWGGCNSYSYYTLPFFELKARAARGSDPRGTKNLDVIANGLPSWFSLNSMNARTVLAALLGGRATYQEIIDRIEGDATRYGTVVLAAVIGDEDNL